MTCYPLGDPRNTIRNNTDLLLYRHRHNQPLPDGDPGTWTTWPPGLLDQLHEAIHGTPGIPTRNAFESKPVINTNALALIEDIRNEALDIITQLGQKPNAHNEYATTRQIAGLTPRLTETAAHHIARRTSAWITQARIIIGTETPSRRIPGTCPECGTPKTLRATADETGTTATAICTECRTIWRGQEAVALGTLLQSPNVC